MSKTYTVIQTPARADPCKMLCETVAEGVAKGLSAPVLHLGGDIRQRLLQDLRASPADQPTGQQ